MSVETFAGLFVAYGYWMIFAVILLDNAGLPIPGELLLLTAGAFARNGEQHLGPAVLVAALAAVSGDSVGYWLRLTGARALHTYCRVTLGSERCVRRAVSYYHHYGTLTVIMGRFVMGIRAFVAPLAGAVGLGYRRFLVVDSIGALLWSGLFIFVGYSFGWTLAAVHDGYRTGVGVLLAAVVLAASVYLVVKFSRRRRHGVATVHARAMARASNALARLRHPTVTTTTMDSDHLDLRPCGMCSKCYALKLVNAELDVEACVEPIRRRKDVLRETPRIGEISVHVSSSR